MKAGNGHKIWLPCVGGIGRITVILGFVSAQVPQSFFFFLLLALLLWACRFSGFVGECHSFTCSLRGLLLCCVQSQARRYLPWPIPTCAICNRNLSKCLDTDGILLCSETDFLKSYLNLIVCFLGHASRFWGGKNLNSWTEITLWKEIPMPPSLLVKEINGFTCVKGFHEIWVYCISCFSFVYPMFLCL